MGKFVTGVGSRRVDETGAKRIQEIAILLNRLGYTLRSGGADGCDTLFEQNMIRKEIYLPWADFNGNNSKLYNISNEAYRLAASVHPGWYKLKKAVQKLHARNTYQVLGSKLDSPSDLLVCWTPDGAKREYQTNYQTGGTRTAIVLADRKKVPVFNLKNDLDYQALKNKLTKELTALQ